MSEGLEAVTTVVMSLALDAAAMRQQAIATNIANVNTDGYVPLTVSFEDQLEDARRSMGSRGRLDMGLLSDVSPRLTTNAGFDESGQTTKVQLDMEVASLAQNAVQYQALIKGLAKHYAILSAAVSDGKK